MQTGIALRVRDVNQGVVAEPPENEPLGLGFSLTRESSGFSVRLGL
jgi:hypothetical protein